MNIEQEVLQNIAETCCVKSTQIEDVYPCTPLQSRAMAESAIHTGNSVFQLVLSLDDSVSLSKLSSAVREVISANTILRTRLVDCNDLGVMQVVIDEAYETTNVQGLLNDFLHQDRKMPMELGSPLFRSVVVDGKWVVTMHHAIMDHTSLGLIYKDVVQVYTGQPVPRRSSFKDFAAHCGALDRDASNRFWASRFKGTPAVFPSVGDNYAPVTRLRKQTTLRDFRVKEGISIAHLPLYIELAWALTQSAYTGSSSVAFGTLLSGRSHGLTSLSNTLGPTIETIPVQVNLPRTSSVEALIRERAAALREVQSHPALHFGLANIALASDSAQAASRFQTVVNIRPTVYHAADSETSGLTYDFMCPPSSAYALSLNCNVGETTTDEIDVEILSDPNIVDERQLTRVLATFTHSLRTLLECEPEAKIGSLSLLSSEDSTEIHEWNKEVGTRVNKTIPELFREKVSLHPDAMAIDAWDGTFTYRELDDTSDVVANHLHNIGVASKDAVAIIFEKSRWATVAALAILKAGAVCIPIDTSEPHDRKAKKIASVQAKLLLTSRIYHASCEDLCSGTAVVDYRSIEEMSSTQMITPPRSPNSNDFGHDASNTLAYILFTSGSSGTPKGVMLEHGSLVTIVMHIADRLSWQQGTKILQFASYIWDISIGEKYGALLSGGCICVPSDEQRRSQLAEYIQSSSVEWAWLTPTVLRTLAPNEVPDLKGLLCIGEAIDSNAASTWGARLRLINGWGPCEASILSCMEELGPESVYHESIGQAFCGSIWIAHPTWVNELLPIGAVGELVIEGPGVSRGYLDAKVTASSKQGFISPPSWAPQRPESSTSRFYRTGDLGKYNADGSITFIGRLDEQVKVRGQRVELGEVEAAIARCSQVNNVLCTTKIMSGRTELIAVLDFDDLSQKSDDNGETVVESSTGDLEKAMDQTKSVREELADKVPSYMIPSIWVPVQSLPKTSSAKLDRQQIKSWLKTKDLSSAHAAMSEAISTTTTKRLTPPSTSYEKTLQAIWAAVLGVPEREIGRESSFTRLGGDSIQAMQVANRCRKEGLYNLTAGALIIGDSLSSIASTAAGAPMLKQNPSTGTERSTGEEEGTTATLHLGNLQEPLAEIPESMKPSLDKMAADYPSLQADNIERAYPATDVQSMMLAAGQLGSNGYQMSWSLNFSPGLDKTRVREACERVIQHHPILRAVYVHHESRMYTVIVKTPSQPSIMELQGGLDDVLNETLDMNGKTLARFHLCCDGTTCHALRFEIHHALYDIFSLHLIFKDLVAAFDETPLSQGPHHHSWIAHSDDLDKSIAVQYWKRFLDGSRPVSLASRTPGIAYHMHGMAAVHVPIELLQHPELGATPAQVLKAAWSIVLSASLGTTDVIFGEVSTNRYLPLEDLALVRGSCINYVPTRARIDECGNVSDLMTHIKDQSVRGLPHHHLGYLSLVQQCTSWPSQARLSTVFLYQNHGFSSSFTIDGSRCSLSHRGNLGDSADAFLVATPTKENVVRAEVYFSPSLLGDRLGQWLADALKAVVSHMARHPGANTQDLTRKLRDSLPVRVQSESMPRLETPNEVAFSLVDTAWEGFGLPAGGDERGDPRSLDSKHGAGLVTCLLLAKYYATSGFDVTAKEMMQCQSKESQVQLLLQQARVSRWRDNGLDST